MRMKQLSVYSIATTLVLWSAVSVNAGANLSESEIELRTINEKHDIRNLRQKDTFVVDRSEDFLKLPDREYATEFTVAETPPTVKFQILPNLEPEYFSADDLAYQAGWANWAKVTRSDDNRFYMAASDHRGRGAQINIYEYRPDDGVVERVLNVGETLGWHDDMYTDGKIHGRMGIMPDGTLWAATHRGPEPTAEWWEEGYRGSWLLSYNIHTGESRNWGVPLIGNELPCHTLDSRRGVFVATGHLTPTMVSWDVNEKRVRFAGYPPNGWKWHPRSMFLDEETGHFWGMDYTEYPYHFMSFDPELNRFKRHEVKVPNNPFGHRIYGSARGILRGHTKYPDADGWYYWATLNGTFFRFRPDWDNGPEVEELGVTWDKGQQVLQMAICPARRYVYYQPIGHPFPPLVQYDITTGQRKVIGYFAEYYEKTYGYSAVGAGGVYGLEISDDGSFIVMVDNGTFGRRSYRHPALTVIMIPESERPLD